MNETARPVFFNDLDFSTYETSGGYEHMEYNHNVSITTTNIRQNRQGLEAELLINAPDYQVKKEALLLHLQDHRARQNLALELAVTGTEPLPWDKILEYVASETIRRYRSLSNIYDIGAEPESLSIEYAIQDILPLNLPTTMYSPGGRGKSILAEFIAVIYEYGIIPEPLPIAPRMGHVLYLDWESDYEIHRKYIRAIKIGLGLTEHREIAYLSCTNPLTAIIESVRQTVYEKDIELVIIDSQMAATAGAPQGLSEAQLASEYYNCLHSLKCTTLTIDHVSKEGMKSQDGSNSPYGSVVKYNRARSIYEIRTHQEAESDHMELALIHQKFNLGRKQKPLGIAIDFENAGGELWSIKFSQCDLADNPVLNKALPCKERIFKYLLESGAMTTENISSELEIDQDTTRVTLNRNKKMFVKIGDEWGVLKHEA